MYILLTGEPPFNGDDMDELFDNIKTKDLDFNCEDLSEVSADAKELLKQLLDKDYKKRPSASDALLHPWFKNA